MNGTMFQQNSTCNQNQISKTLPFKKRRAYMDNASTMNAEQTDYYPMPAKRTCSPEDSLKFYLPTPSIVPTPPSSPHVDLLRQQYAYLLANQRHFSKQNYVQPLICDASIEQQYMNHYRVAMKQQQNYPFVEEQEIQADTTVDDHYKKSLANSYNHIVSRSLTPDDSQSNSSVIERAPVDSIEEHFARSLAKFRPVNSSSSTKDPISLINHQITESVVDDHFAKALGAVTWGKLKEKL